MPDTVQLGRKVKNKYPGVYDDIPDGVLGQKVKAKYPGAYDDFVDATYTPPQEPEGMFSSFQTGVAGPLLRNVVETATDVYNRPLETLQRAGRGALEFVSAFDPAGNAYDPTGPNAQRIAELRRSAEAERPETVRMMERGMQVEEAKPRTKAGRIALGTGRVLGEVAFPTAPETAVQNVAMAPFGGAAAGAAKQAFRASVGAVRRTFGKGAAQIIEAEAARATGPALAEATPTASAAAREVPAAVGEANPTVQNAMQQFEQEVARIKELPPAQQATEMEAAIRRISSEASGIRPVDPQVRAGYPGPLEFPENPNAIQMRPGVLPGEEARIEGPPPLSAEFGTPEFGVKAAPDLPYTETLGPALGEDALNATVTAAQSLPKRVVNNTLEPFRLLRSVLASGDISAPFRQGALLTLNPSQWVNGNVPRAALRMFKSFSTKQYENIAKAIGADLDGQIGQKAGLEFTSQGLEKGEEYFLSRLAKKLPVLKQSEQAYKTYLDSLRLDRFKGFKKAIDKAGLSPEQTENAYKAAADWINIATGRGSFGKTIDKALPVLNEVLFAPRNLASRLQILNPATYAKNAATPGGRIVLKEQMKDLLQFAGTVAGVYQLAKAAGAEVSTNPNSPDFLKIRAGRYRYDPLAGVQQVMRLVYRVGAEIERKATGQKSTGDDALDIAGRFLRSKLAPVPSYFADFLTGRTYTGKPFEQGKAIYERTIPLQWQDFVEAYQAEGFGGVAKSLPGAFGVGTQQYDQHPIDAALDKAQPLFSELQRLNKKVSDLRQIENEPKERFQGRVQQFGSNYTQYGLALLNNERFKAASDEVKGKVLDALNARAKAITNSEFAFPELELDADTLMDSVESSIEREKERKRQRGF